MLWFTLAILALSGCGVWSEEVVHEDACGCTITVPPGFWLKSGLVDDAIIERGRQISEVYLVVEAAPRDTLAPLSLVSYALAIAANGDEPADPLAPPVFREFDGRPAVFVDVSQDHDGLLVTKRFGIVDSGERLIFLQFWSLQDRWEAALPLIDQMIDSFALDPFDDIVPWEGEPDVVLHPRDLLALRADNPTHVSPIAKGGPARVPADAPFSVVHYPSAVGGLAAYLSRDPGDGRQHPAVLWVSGGFGGPSPAVTEPQPAEDDQSALPFHEAGLVVMVPSFRGELDNPGHSEWFFGETADLIDAIAWLKTVPYVDPERVYLAGHSTGGTQVLLAAASTDTFRAGFSFGGRASMKAVVAEGGYGGEPYDIRDPMEVTARSAIHWADRIQRPLFYFEGEQAYTRDGIAMAVAAQKAGRPMQAFAVHNGDHATILAPVKRLVIAQILADTGPEPTLSFAEEELYAAMVP